MVGLVTLAAQADDPVLILGDKPGDVQQVLASGGPPVLLADGRLLMVFSGGEKGQQKTLGRYGSDHGSTWGKPVPMFESPATRDRSRSPGRRRDRRQRAVCLRARNLLSAAPLDGRPDRQRWTAHPFGEYLGGKRRGLNRIA